MFLFIKNFLLLLKLDVIIHTHSALIVFRKFLKPFLIYKYLSGIQLNNIFCIVERILHLFNTDTSDSRLLIIILYLLKFLNLEDINLLINLLINLKLQKRHSF